MGKEPDSQIKVPKGTKDWFGDDVLIRNRIFQAAEDVFARHGGTPLDTPVFELKHILAGKYGEDSKLIYDLADQGGEISSLRYDLTVPFARFLAMNKEEKIKRYSIAKVYRRDQPAMNRGRFREFYQMDFDIAGEYDSMIPDAEVLRIVVDVFEKLDLTSASTIKLNHRKILDGLFEVAGVPEDKIRTISSAVDKLDKMSWEEVKKEMLEKGLESDVADRVGGFVQRSGLEAMEFLRTTDGVSSNDKIKKGLEEMDRLFKYLDAFQVTEKVKVDFTLARGLDYYTGIIYEVVMEMPSESKSETRIGSIAAGGRYDNLVGMYGKRQIPCVGVSFGVDRIFAVLKARAAKEKKQPRKFDVYVIVLGGNGLLTERMAVASTLWKAGLRAEFMPKVKAKLPQQFKAAETYGAPVVVILGEDEMKAGKVKVKIMGLEDGHPEKDGRTVPQEEMVAEVKKALETVDGGEALPLR